MGMSQSSPLPTVSVVGVALVVLVTQCLLLRPAEAEETVKVTVLSIKATKSDSGQGVIDRRLEAIAEQLKKLKKAVPYDSFALLGQKSLKGAYGEEQSFKLPEKLELTVTPLERKDGSLRLTVRLYGLDARSGKKKQIMPKLNVTVKPHTGIPIAGPTFKDGSGLIMVISAE